MNPEDPDKSAVVRVIPNMWPGRIALEFARRMAPLVIYSDSAKRLVENSFDNMSLAPSQIGKWRLPHKIRLRIRTRRLNQMTGTHPLSSLVNIPSFTNHLVWNGLDYTSG